MSTRLYPKTTNPEILEVLAGVPEGTHELIQQMLKQHTKEMHDLNDLYLAARACGAVTKAIEDEIFITEESYNSKLSASCETKQLDQFLVFGWGKLSTKASKVLAEFGTPSFGELSCPVQTELVLQAQGVQLPHKVEIKHLDGLAWN